MYLSRTIDEQLFLWKSAQNRKPLILRGTRQVGKTSSVRNLAQHFTHFVEINFDETQDYTTVFENTMTVSDVCEKLAVLTNTPIIPGETLLFLDEIQASIPAITMLRYFYEKMHDLHVIAAGSLLEFALADIPSFGTGRVRSMFMYPLSFREFLLAQKEYLLLELLDGLNEIKPLSEPIHQKLINLHKKFLIIGGMPEAVRTYIDNKDMLEVQRVLNDLVISIQADFIKYKNRVPASRLIEVYNALALQTATKFTYSYPNATFSNVQVKEALELLKMAGLIYPVTHSAANGIPLGAEINPKKIKYLIFDTGIFQRILGLNIADLMIREDFSAINKGYIAELHVGLELIKSEICYEKTDLYYWQREAKNSQAEVDYVCQFENNIVPVEVKAGTKGSMQSMYLFLKEKNLLQGFRISFENFSSVGHITILPIYAVQYLRRYLLKK